MVDGGKQSQISVRLVFFIVLLLSLSLVVFAVNNSLNETLSNDTPLQFSVLTDKQSYESGETVNITVFPPQSSYFIKVIGPLAEQILDVLQFVPQEIGNYTVLASLSLDNYSANLSAGFEVVPPLATPQMNLPQNLTADNFDSEKEKAEVEKRIKDANVKKIERKNNSLELEIESKDKELSIQFSGLENTTDLKEIKKFGINNKIKDFGREISFSTDAVFVDVSKIDSATITIAKKGEVNTVLYCADKEFDGDCGSGWEETSIPFIDSGDTITFEVSHFTTYAGGWVNQTFGISGTYNQTQSVGNSITLNFSYAWKVTENLSSTYEESTVLALDSDYLYVGGDDRIPGNFQWKVQKRNLKDGSLVWNFSKDPAGNDYVSDLFVDSQALYFGAYSTSGGSDRIWNVEKRNLTDGSVIWNISSNPSANSDILYGITANSDFLYAVGSDYIPGNSEFRIEKRNLTTGAQAWNISYNPSANEDVLTTAVLDSEALYVGGYDDNISATNAQWIMQKRNLTDGSLIWNISSNPGGSDDLLYSLAIDSSGIYAAGSDYTASFNYQWRLEKRNLTDGSLIWNISSNPTSGNDIPYSIAIDASYIYAGGTENNNMWRIEKRNLTDGSLIWNISYDPNPIYTEAIYSIVVDSRAVYVTGTDYASATGTDTQWDIQARNLINGSLDGVYYYNSGQYFDILDANQTVIWDRIYYQNSTPAGTNITYQVATSSDNSTWSNFTGPDKTSSTYYNESAQALNASNSRYFKYRFYLATSDNTITPAISNITVKYNYANYPPINETTNSSSTTQLKIWDSSDGGVYSSLAYFYANYSNFTSGQSINGTGAYCNISTNESSTWSSPASMTFNTTTLLYEYSKYINNASAWFNVYCDGAVFGYDALNATDEIVGTMSICDEGDFLTTCNVTSAKSVIINNYALQANNLNIKSGGSINASPGNLSFTINLTGNLTIFSGGRIETSVGANQTAGNITINANSINVSGNIESHGGGCTGNGCTVGRSGLLYISSNSFFVEGKINVSGKDMYNTSVDYTYGGNGGSISLNSAIAYIASSGIIASEGGYAFDPDTGNLDHYYGGNGGTFNITSTNVTQKGTLTVRGGYGETGFFAGNNNGYGGNGGAIIINAANEIISEGTVDCSGNYGFGPQGSGYGGDGGKLNLSANITIVNSSIYCVGGKGYTTGSFNTFYGGDGGNITINASISYYGSQVKLNVSGGIAESVSGVCSSPCIGGNGGIATLITSETTFLPSGIFESKYGSGGATNGSNGSIIFNLPNFVNTSQSIYTNNPTINPVPWLYPDYLNCSLFNGNDVVYRIKCNLNGTYSFNNPVITNYAEVYASGTFALNNLIVNNSGMIYANNNLAINAGNITIDNTGSIYFNLNNSYSLIVNATKNIDIKSGGQISSSVGAGKTAGNMTVYADVLNVSGSISSMAYCTSDNCNANNKMLGGKVKINANLINISGSLNSYAYCLGTQCSYASGADSNLSSLGIDIAASSILINGNINTACFCNGTNCKIATSGGRTSQSASGPISINSIYILNNGTINGSSYCQGTACNDNSDINRYARITAGGIYLNSTNFTNQGKIFSTGYCSGTNCNPDPGLSFINGGEIVVNTQIYNSSSNSNVFVNAYDSPGDQANRTGGKINMTVTTAYINGSLDATGESENGSIYIYYVGCLYNGGTFLPPGIFTSIGVDTDGDTINDVCDNCKFNYNPDQNDTYEFFHGQTPDGVGDACDAHIEYTIDGGNDTTIDVDVPHTAYFELWNDLMGALRAMLYGWWKIFIGGQEVASCDNTTNCTATFNTTNFTSIIVNVTSLNATFYNHTINTTLDLNITVKNITATASVTGLYQGTRAHPGDALTIYGTAAYENSSAAAGISYNITNLGNNIISGTTNSSGGYYNTTSTFNSSQLGQYTAVVSLTDQNGVSGNTSFAFEVWAPALVNYTFDYSSNYVDVLLSNINITTYYYRNDTNTSIPGAHNITFNGTTQSCGGAQSCLKSFTSPQTLGNYQMTFFAKNDSAYYDNASNMLSFMIVTINATLNLDSTLKNRNESITLSGHVSLNNQTNIANASYNFISVYVDNVSLSNKTSTNGIVAYYHFDNQSIYGENSSKVYDFSGNGNNGTVIGAAWNESGKINGSYRYDGVGDYINIGNTASLRLENSTSISVWFKTNATSGIGNPIMGNYLHAGRFTGYDIAVGPEPYLWFRRGPADYVQYYVQGMDLSDNNWHNLVLVYPADGTTPLLYIDSINQSLFILVSAGNSALFGLNDSSENISIGRNTFTDASKIYYNFTGSIDELMIFNRSLSAAEVSNIYTSSSYYTNALGDFNFTTTSPITAGNHTIKINLTDQYGIYGQKNTTFTVRIPLDNASALSGRAQSTHTTINESTNISVIIPSANIGSQQLDKAWVELTKEYYTTTNTLDKDTYVDQANPTFVYDASNIRIGESTGNDLTAFVYFNLSSLPAGAQIESAYLQLYSFTGQPKNLSFHIVTQDWDEATLTWNTRPAYNLTAGANYSYNNLTELNTYSNIDITNITRALLSGTNFGIAIVANYTPNSDVKFRDSESAINKSQITITYSVPQKIQLSGPAAGGVWSTNYTNNTQLGRYRAKFFANLSNGINDSLETIAYYDVERMELNYTFNATQFTTTTLTVYGLATLYNSTASAPVQNRNITAYLDGALNTTALTNSTGGFVFNITFGTALGQKSLFSNATTNYSVYAQKNDSFILYAKTFVNYTYSYSYTPNSSFNITAYYYRNDTNASIPGNFSITVNGTAKTCPSATSCSAVFYTPEDVQPENQTVTLTAENMSSYYWQGQTTFKYRFEKNRSTPNRIANDYLIQGYNASANFTYLYNVTLNNSNDAKLTNASINFNFATQDSKVVSVQKLSNNCNNLTYLQACYETFNITVKSGLLATDEYFMDWIFNWTNNDNTLDSQQEQIRGTIEGNPSYNTNSRANLFNTTLGIKKTAVINITSTGNKHLVNISITNPYPALFLFYQYQYTAFQYSDIPAPVFTGTGWTRMCYTCIRSLGINFTLTNFSYADYVYTFNVSLTPEGEPANFLNDSFNITIQVRPNMTATQSITISTNLSQSKTVDTNINITGNVPLTNVTLSLINSTIPSNWVNLSSTENTFSSPSYTRLNESTSNNLRVTVNVQNNSQQNYTGLIKIKSDENVERYINLSIIVAPDISINTTQITFSQDHNTTASESFRIASIGNINVTNINITFNSSQINTSFITITPNNLTNLIENNYYDFTVMSTIPEYYPAGQYNGTIQIRSDNVAIKTINITINVLVDNTWFFTTTYSSSLNFSLNVKGDLANITIFNTGNIPLNFTIDFITLNGSCVFGVSGRCIDYNYLNGTEVALTSWVYLPLNSNKTVRMAQDVNDNDPHNATLLLNISETNANPAWDTTLIEFNILDQPSTLFSIDFIPANKICEFNKQFNITAGIADDIGVDETEFRINITKPDSVIESYLVSLSDDAPGFPNGDLDYFSLGYNNTNISGIYNITIISKDSTNKYSYFYYNFTTIGSTNMTLASTQATIYNVTQANPATGSSLLTLNNTGLVTAYNINITGNFSLNASSFTYEQINITSIASSQAPQYSLNITAPQATLPGTYYFNPKVTWTNPNGSIAESAFQAIPVIVAEKHQFNITGQNTSLNIGHSTWQLQNFTINATGNLNETNITINAMNVSSNVNVYISPSTLSALDIGSPQIITLNISVDTSTPPSTRNFTIVANNSGFQANYTAIVTIPTSTVYTISHNNTNLTIQGVADVNTTNTEVWVKSYANVNLSLVFSLSGNMTTFADADAQTSSNLTASARTLTPGENYTVSITYKSPKDNNYYFANLTINSTIMPVHFYNHFYDLNILNVSSPAQTLPGDTINVTLEIQYGSLYINENTTYQIRLNNTPCTTTTFLSNSNNKTYLQCTAPALPDGATYQLNVYADYNNSGTIIPGIAEADAPNLANALVYYKDVTAPNMTGSSATNGTLTANVTVYANLTDNVAIDKAIIIMYDELGTNVANYTMAYQSGNTFNASIAMTLFGYYYLDYFANDTSGNGAVFPRHDWIHVFDNVTWQGNTLSSLNDKAHPTAEFNLSKPSGIKIDFATDSEGNYSSTFQTDYYNTKMALKNTPDVYCNTSASMGRDMTINLTGVSFQNVSNTDFIDMYYLCYNQISGEAKNIYSKPIRGIAIQSSFAAPVASIEIPFMLSELDFLKSGVIPPSLNWSTDVKYMKIYYCPYWYFQMGSSRCFSSWEMLNTQIITEGVSQYKAKASYQTNLNSSVAFILGVVDEDTAVVSTDASSYITQINHSSSKNQNIYLLSSGTSDVTNLYVTCSGSACSFINFNKTLYPFIIASTNDTLIINISVPKYTPAGNYTSNINLSHDGGSTIVPYTVEVLGLENCTSSLPKATYEVGGSMSGELTNLSIRNEGNTVCSVTLVSSTQNITLAQTAPQVSPNTTYPVLINYSAPHTMGLYRHNITTSKGELLNISLNVTHQADIFFLSPTQNIFINDPIMIVMNATWLGGVENNANWTVYFNDTPCNNVQFANNTITCSAPQVEKSKNQTIIMTGTFQGRSAKATALVTFQDIVSPYITNISPSADINLGLPVINATFYDDTGLGGGTTVELLDSSNNSLGYLNFTTTPSIISVDMASVPLGDHIIRFNLQDVFGNPSTGEIYDVEIYEGVNLSGTVDWMGIGLQTNFTFYKPGTSTTIHFLNTDNDGDYSVIGFHNRNYDLKIVAQDFEMNLLNVTFQNFTDIIDISGIDWTLINIINPSGRDYDIMGYAGTDKLNATGGNLTLCYNPQYHQQQFGETISFQNVHMIACQNFNYTTMTCAGAWSDLNIPDNQKVVYSNIYRCVYATGITGFSAYVLSEFEPQTFDPQNLAQVTARGGGGGGWSEGIGEAEFNSTIGALKQALEAVEKIGVDVSEIEKELYPGEVVRGIIKVANDENETVNITASLAGTAADFIRLDTRELGLGTKQIKDLYYTISVPSNIRVGSYTGELLLIQPRFTKRIPINIRVIELKEQQVGFEIKPETNIIAPGKTLNVHANIYNPLGTPINVTLTFELINPDLEMPVKYLDDTISVDNFYSYTASFNLEDSFRTGNYVLRARADYERANKSFEIKDFENVVVARPLLYKKLGPLMTYEWLLVLLVVAIITSVYYGGKVYVESKKRYHLQVDVREIPRNPGPRSAFIGNLAETNMRLFFDLDKLTTHTIIAGSTGGGKSISAQVLAEEALMKGIAVVVFDPTAQWSGFLRRLEDKRLLELYPQFGMTRAEAKPFNGNIHQIENARQKIDLKKFMIPGEIHVFTINKLEPKDIDIFVTNTVRDVFHANFEESQTLKTLLIYDEVHRLLTKFGGSGEGFIQIERACREFRKWGIGVLLVSQVLSDFVGQIKANINTEIQVRTKDEGDLDRLRTKYGDEMLKAVIRANVGTGMLANAAYNRGRPFFVTFRPILHSVKRLTDDELEKYNKFNVMIEDYSYQIEQLAGFGVDTFDIKIELNLALKKLKAGSFGMVTIYIEGLKPKIDMLWKKIGKTPKKLELELISSDELTAEQAKAKQEREAYLKDKSKKADEKIKEIATPQKAEENIQAAPQAKIEEPASLQKETKKLDTKKHSALKHETKKHEVPKKQEPEKAPRKTGAPPSPTIEDEVGKFVDEYVKLKDVTERLKRLGVDVMVEEAQLNGLSADINILKATKDKNDLEKLKIKAAKIKQELLAIKNQ